MTGPVEPVAVVADVVRAVGLDVDTDEVGKELAGFVTGPWAAYRAGAGAGRSSLTDSGAPFELSVKIGAGGQVSVRYVVDVADPSVDLAGNVGRYVEAAVRVTRQPEEVVRRLLSVHLHDAPEGMLANVMVGVGWATGPRRRGTVYLPASWVRPDQLDERLPGPTGLAQAAQVVGYDFEDGSFSCWKTYHWFPVDPAAPLTGTPDAEALPALAVVVHDLLAHQVPPPARDRATFRQRRFGSDGAQDRLFLFTRPWGLTSGPPMRTLLAALSDAGLDLAPLRVVSRASQDRQLPMHVGLVSVGGQKRPSATFYFWPLPRA